MLQAEAEVNKRMIMMKMTKFPTKKMHAIITTSRTEQEITDCFIEWNKK